MLRLLRNAQIYAPDPLGRRDLLIADRRIAAIAPSLPKLPAEIPHEEIDLGGLLLTPGLIDAHVHLIGGGGEAGPATRVPPLHLSELSSAGVTTVVGILGTDGTTRSVGDLVARTLGLREEGLDAHCYTGSYQLPLVTLTGSARGDIVYVDPIIGVGELALSDHRSSQVTLDELLRVASDAHVAGMISGKAGIVHLHMGDGPRGLELVRRALEHSEIPPRVFHPTHINRNRRLFAEALEFAARGSYLDVSAFPEDDDPGDSLMAAEAISRWFHAGLPGDRLTCSSDGGGCMPKFDGHGHICGMDVGTPATLLQTIATLLADRLPLERFLPAFTRNVADLLRWPHKGRIEVGAAADLLALTSDGKLSAVLARGTWLVRDGRPVVFGRFERSSA